MVLEEAAMPTLKDQEEAARMAEKVAKTAMKDERARDAARAMQEYQAERLAVLAKTARLRELRLAQEAGSVAKKKATRQAKGKR
jgi:malic enzyme